MLRDSDVAYLDGSKNQMEMACIVNMRDFLPDVDGMQMPRVKFGQISDIFRLKEQGEILSKKQVVGVVNCRDEDETLVQQHLRGGVFAVFTALHPAVGYAPDRRQGGGGESRRQVRHDL